MRMRLLGMLLVPVTLAGCGDGPIDDGDRMFQSSDACQSAAANDHAVLVLRVDLDGDGASEEISYLPPTRQCAPMLAATVDGRDTATQLEDDLPVRAGGSFAITMPGHAGEVAVVRQEHPRGGFQLIVVGWARGTLASLEADRQPLFPFIATDVQTTPLSARCTGDGFEILAARTHQPVGVVPAWDIDRTTYTVDGNEVTMGPVTEVADNVLDAQLEKEYADLVHHRLFENCITER